MKHVAKLAIIDARGKYLLLQRNNHPTFGNDPDLPGGTLEEGESPLETMIREVFEEAAIEIDAASVRTVYAGVEYSPDMHYSLYIARLQNTPDVTMSWEHSSYEWLERGAFLEKASKANDRYMHMVYHVLTNNVGA